MSDFKMNLQIQLSRFFLNLLIILFIVGTVVVLLNRSGYAAPRDNEAIEYDERNIDYRGLYSRKFTLRA